MNRPRRTSWVIGVVLLGTLAGCAAITPQKARQIASEMNDFELCLAVQAKMDRRTFALEQEVLEAAKTMREERSVDCAAQHQAIVDFLVRALREEERRFDRYRFHFGLGFIRG